MSNPICQYEDFEDEYKDEKMTYERRRRFTNSNLTGETNFLTLTGPSTLGVGLLGRRQISYPNHDRKGEYASPDKYLMNIEISFF